MLTKALEQAASTANSGANIAPGVAVPKDIPVMLQIGDTSLWHSKFNEREMKYFVENTEQEDLVFKEYEGTVYLWLEIKPEDAEWRTSYKNVQTCAYDGTEKYLKSLFGVELHYSDKEWYKEHPAVVGSGLPDEATLGVLQALVKPYGFGISEVLMKRGRGKTADTAAWRDVLGINPMSLCNNLTTDEDYLAEFASLDPVAFKIIEDDVASNRFRYVDEVRGPAVIFGSIAQTNYASGGGHARYLAPRERSESFQYAVRFARLSTIEYKGDVDALVNDFSGKVEPKKELAFWQTKYKGKTLTSLTSWSSKSHGAGGGHSSSGGYSGSSKSTGPNYTPPKPKPTAPDRLPGEALVALSDAEEIVPGFIKLCSRSGIGKVYEDDLTLDPDLINDLFSFCKTKAEELGSKIKKIDWTQALCKTEELCNQGEAAKSLRREIRKFRNEVATNQSGLINFALAAERMDNDCQRWILYTLAREVYV